jgi:hypothetical protein
MKLENIFLAKRCKHNQQHGANTAAVAGRGCIAVTSAADVVDAAAPTCADGAKKKGRRQKKFKKKVRDYQQASGDGGVCGEEVVSSVNSGGSNGSEKSASSGGSGGVGTKSSSSSSGGYVVKVGDFGLAMHGRKRSDNNPIDNGGGVTKSLASFSFLSPLAAASSSSQTLSSFSSFSSLSSIAHSLPFSACRSEKGGGGGGSNDGDGGGKFNVSGRKQLGASWGGASAVSPISPQLLPISKQQQQMQTPSTTSIPSPPKRLLSLSRQEMTRRSQGLSKGTGKGLLLYSTPTEEIADDEAGDKLSSSSSDTFESDSEKRSSSDDDDNDDDDDEEGDEDVDVVEGEGDDGFLYPGGLMFDVERGVVAGTAPYQVRESASGVHEKRNTVFKAVFFALSILVPRCNQNSHHYPQPHLLCFLTSLVSFNICFCFPSLRCMCFFCRCYQPPECFRESTDPSTLGPDVDVWALG